jgi:hypothetical protein
MQGVAVNMSAQPKTGKARTRPKVNVNIYIKQLTVS